MNPDDPEPKRWRFSWVGKACPEPVEGRSAFRHLHVG